MKILRHITLISLWLLACSSSGSGDDSKTGEDGALNDYAASLPLNSIKLPDGFVIEVFAEVTDARSMALSPSGVLYVGNKNKDRVYAVKDTDGDFKADKKWIVASGLNMPNGVAFNNGDLYIAEVSRILKLVGIESRLDNPPDPVVVRDDYPNEAHHGWKYIAFGPEGKLYIPVGAPCNICEPDREIYAGITRMNKDGSDREIFARGIRNSVGFTWHPVTRELWFTDNGRDSMGDDVPSCELNRAPTAGMHFGYPYCHAGTVKDPQFGNKRSCTEFTPPADKLGAHVAPLGLKFYDGKMFPTEYKNQLFVAEHGSWDRSKKSGYNVSLVKMSSNSEVAGHSLFASGWLDVSAQRAWGRPVDVLIYHDGSMLISDDRANVIYRISYKK